MEGEDTLYWKRRGSYTFFFFIWDPCVANNYHVILVRIHHSNNSGWHGEFACSYFQRIRDSWFSSNTMRHASLISIESSNLIVYVNRLLSSPSSFGTEHSLRWEAVMIAHKKQFTATTSFFHFRGLVLYLLIIAPCSNFLLHLGKPFLGLSLFIYYYYML